MKATISNKNIFSKVISAVFIFWLIDSLLDVYLFKNADTLSESFFTQDANELWMRLSVVSLLFAFSWYAKKTEEIIKQQQNKIQENTDISSEMEFLETVDPLTLLFNKRKFYELLEYEMDKDKRYQSGLSIIFCGVDDFESIEEKNSHYVVDNFLRNIALQLVKILRTSDIVSHWNNDEFLILIPNITADETKIIAEKIRSSIESYDFSGIPKITSSLGISQYIEDDNKVTIVERAKTALNAAKEKGGNNIELMS